MAKDKFPYTACMLTPACVVRKVTVTADVTASGYTGYVQLETGTRVHKSMLFTTKKAAIESGKKALEGRRARLAKSVANIEKHAANLAKAEATNG